MSTTSRRKNTPVISQLEQRPFDFSFQQAVRLLERAAVFVDPASPAFAKNPVARFTPPANEVVRFHSRPSLSFPSAELDSITVRKNANSPNQWRMFVNFLGLAGSCGVLPYHYSELVQQRLKHKDKSLLDFLDLFNHRTISLFYQASTKYNLPLEYERKQLNPLPGTEGDNHTQVLLSLIGLGSRGLQRRLHTKDESLLYYAGLFTSKVRSASGLKQIIRHHFGIPVEISEFIGQWQELIDDVRTRLPSPSAPRGQNNQLGKSLMLGRKGWFAQGKIRIILGPLSKEQLPNFAPGTATLKALDEIVRLYINFEYDYDYVMRIRRTDIPERIRLNKATPSIMGWNTWLSTRTGKYTGTDTTVDIPVSANRLR